MTRPLAWIVCASYKGHDWGPWSTGLYENLLGLKYKCRWCQRCGTRDIASPW